MTGAMRPQGSRLSGLERRAVAEFVTGRRVGGDVTGAEGGRCAAGPSAGSIRNLAKAPRWIGWSPSPTNTRFQPADQAGLKAEDVPRLSLKWSFGFPDATSRGRSRRSPMDACSSGARTARSTRSTRGRAASSGRSPRAAASAPRLRCLSARDCSPTLVYFGDTAANVYALNADTGALTGCRTRRASVRADHRVAVVARRPPVRACRLL